MTEWYAGLSVLEQVYFWIAAVATVLLVVQVILLCFSSFGGDLDLDGDGTIDIDTDSGVSIFTVKGITAFLAVGGWVGLLTSTLAPDSLQWLSVITALVAGVAAWALVVVLMRMMLKLQCNGALEPDKLAGKRATVYVSIPAARGGRGKITLTAQGKFMELDAVTDGEKLSVDETVEILSAESDYTVVRRVGTAPDETETVVGEQEK